MAYAKVRHATGRALNEGVPIGWEPDATSVSRPDGENPAKSASAGLFASTSGQASPISLAGVRPMDAVREGLAASSDALAWVVRIAQLSAPIV
jgi:hypothetical protein